MEDPLLANYLGAVGAAIDAEISRRVTSPIPGGGPSAASWANRKQPL